MMSPSFSSSCSSSSYKLALVLSLSLTASLTTTKQASSHTPKATPLDILSLLGTPQQASSVNPVVAAELTSCFRPLVPLSPPPPPSSLLRSRRLLRKVRSSTAEEEEEEEDGLVWWPPTPMAELARLAVESGGDPDAFYRALDPSLITVPDVEECKEHRCQLTRTPYGRRFINEDLNTYLKFLFELIVVRGPSVGFNVSLSRFDLFHGHIFLASGSGRLGILFHAKEYPVFDKDNFPHNMGFCQIGSNVVYNEDMNLRNILWLAPIPSNTASVAPGVLVVLDARPDGIIYRDIIPEYVDYVRTIYEDDFGDVVADVNYLNTGKSKPDYQIFIC